MKHPLRRAAAACCAALLLGGCATSTQAPAPGSPRTFAPEATGQTVEYKLANGMTLIVKPDRRAPTAVHMLWVRVGAMDEVDGTTGVAHLLEHMLYKGTARLQPGEF